MTEPRPTGNRAIAVGLILFVLLSIPSTGCLGSGTYGDGEQIKALEADYFEAFAEERWDYHSQETWTYTKEDNREPQIETSECESEALLESDGHCIHWLLVEHCITESESRFYECLNGEPREETLCFDEQGSWQIGNPRRPDSEIPDCDIHRQQTATGELRSLTIDCRFGTPDNMVYGESRFLIERR